MNIKGLDQLHTMLKKQSNATGIDRLYTNNLIDELDMEYLIGRQRHEEFINGKLEAWQREIDKAGGFEIYNETALGRKLVMTNEAIDAIERAALGFDVFERALFLELSGLDTLVGSRYTLRNAILAQDMPDRQSGVTDLEIEHARTVRLDSVIPDLPRSRKIVCPFHKEKTPSFHVGKWGYCFGCGAHVDTIGWVCSFWKLTFVQAVRQLNRLID